MKKHSRDILLIAAILLVGGAFALILFLTRRAGAFVEVRVDGEIVCSYPLEIDAEYDISGANGGVNHLVIKNGEAFIERASCPDALCVNMGHIRYVGASVVCLPNRVVVSIAGDGGVDAVSGK